MRLIDAHDIEYEHICGEFRVSEEKINAMPTACDIDAIRTEIEQLTDDKWHVDEFEDGYNTAMKQAIDIIDKYTK